MKNVFCFVFFFLFTSCQKDEVTIDASSKDDIMKVIIAEKNIQNLNAVSFCVIKEDNIVWADAIGKATYSKQATIDTRFLIASVSKAITAVAALKLTENNLLDLDADINSYLPFQVCNPNFNNIPITTRMLLNHSSSISDKHYSMFNFYCWNEDCTIPLGTFLNDFFNSNGQFYSSNSFYNYSPGTQGNYSNMGYALLGYIVERVSDQPFDEYCKQNIFLPLGMTKTEWRLKNTPISELAVPFSPSITSSKPHYTFPDYPNGGIRTTATDISKFLRMIMNNGYHNGNQILLRQTIDLMKKYTLTLHKLGFDFDFGLGLYYFNFKGKVLFGHAGNEQGTSAEMFCDPESKVGVVVFTNTNVAKLDLIVYSLYKYGVEQ